MKRGNIVIQDKFNLSVLEMLRIANEAVQKAKVENKKYGIPEFFWKNGKIYYVLENGDLTTETPDILKS